MKRRNFAFGLVVAIALSSCGLIKPAIVGKWSCPSPETKLLIINEYLSDGTYIQTIEYTDRPPTMKEPFMSDADWEIEKSKKKVFTSTWKEIEGDRISETSNGKTYIYNYKVKGRSLLINPPDGLKCDRL